MESTRRNKNLAILVISCDKYSDLWPMFTFFFKKNWPDCEFDKYLLSNTMEVQDEFFQTLKIGSDKSWSDGLYYGLLKLQQNYKYVLVTLEDSPILKKVENTEFNELVDLFKEIDGNYLKFITKPKPTKNLNDYFGLIEKGSLYRPTCVYALYKIDVIIDLLKSKENAWQFERFGAVRSEKYDRFFVVNRDFFIISNTVVKGKWVRKEYKKITSLGFLPDISGRKLLTRKEEFSLSIKTFFYKLFLKVIPWKYRRSLVFGIKGYAS